jgi:hypothetical protein
MAWALGAGRGGARALSLLNPAAADVAGAAGAAGAAAAAGVAAGVAGRGSSGHRFGDVHRILVASQSQHRFASNKSGSRINQPKAAAQFERDRLKAERMESEKEALAASLGLDSIPVEPRYLESWQGNTHTTPVLATCSIALLTLVS